MVNLSSLRTELTKGRACWGVQKNVCKSFAYYLFADPHPLNSVVSTFYKNLGEGAPTRVSASNLEP